MLALALKSTPGLLMLMGEVFLYIEEGSMKAVERVE